MTKYAFISDIHGNLTALNAVLDDIKKRDVDTIYCLGDIIGKGPRGSECITLVKKHCEKVITGNWELLLQREIDEESIKWFQKHLTPDDFSYIESLPFSIDFYANGKLVRCIHASPRSAFERIIPEYATLEQCLSLFENSDLTMTDPTSKTPDFVFYGDIHMQLLRNYDSKTLCNIGSVGLDYVEACYTILDDAFDVNSIQFCRVPYDREAEVFISEQLNAPNKDHYIQEILVEQLIK